MLSSVLTLSSEDNVVRFLVAMVGTFLAGSNLAFIMQGQELFPNRALRFWRMFFIGKTVLTVYCVIALYGRTGSLGWQTAVIGIGFVASLLALIIIWAERPYHFLVINPDQLTAKQKRDIIRELSESLGGGGSRSSGSG